MRGLNISGLEQIQSASAEDTVAIYTLIDGKTVRSMTDTDMESISDSLMATFFEVVDTAVELGIQFDPWNQDGSNVMYSPEAGFTLIDYFVDYTRTTKEQDRLNGYRSLGSQAVKLARIFGTSNYEFQMEWSNVDDFRNDRWRKRK